VSNNVFAGGVERKAIRAPLPTKDANNVISGNLIAEDQLLFQLEEPLKGDKTMPTATMVSLATNMLRAKNVPRGLWPDFDDWSRSSSWSVGGCGFAAFNAIAGSSANSQQDFHLPRLSSGMDRFTWNGWHGPTLWPAREFGLPGMSPEYTLTLDTTTWPQVKLVKDIVSDYLGETIDPNSTLPGAIAGIKGKKVLTIWPKSAPAVQGK
jgi:hypothetical protein